MKRSLVTARVESFIAATSLGCAVLCGCSSGAEDTEAPQPEKVFGTVDARLQVDPGVTLNSFSYAITGPAGFSKSDTVSVQDSTTISATIAPIPAGTGFDISLTSTAVDSSTTCAGSATFDVRAGQTTPVPVQLACHEAAHTGSVLLTGSLNICPEILGVAAIPTEVVVGHTADVTSSAHDLDQGPGPLTYLWTTDFGTLSDSSAQNPTFTCATAGTAHLTLTVSDGDALATCTDSRTLTVSCMPWN
jgi:hypothetical protein